MVPPLTLAAQCFHLSPPVSRSHATDLASDTISEWQYFTLASSVTFVTLDLGLSLPTPKQLETGEFDLDELVEKFTDALSEDSRRTEILQLTGDIAVSVIECLDKVGDWIAFLNAESLSISAL